MCCRSIRMTSAPSLTVNFSFTVVTVSIWIWGALRFRALMEFCSKTNRSGMYPWVQNALLLLMYLYTPFLVVSVVFMWVSYTQGWGAGYFFVVLPYLSIIGFALVLLISRNDVTGFVEVHRATRARLPFQLAPEPLVVSTADTLGPRSSGRAKSFGGAGTTPSAPALPVQDGILDDDDALE